MLKVTTKKVHEAEWPDMLALLQRVYGIDEEQAERAIFGDTCDKGDHAGAHAHKDGVDRPLTKEDFVTDYKARPMRFCVHIDAVLCDLCDRGEIEEGHYSFTYRC